LDNEMSPQEKLPIVVIACKVLQDVLESLLPKNVIQTVTFMDYGLHTMPNKMTTTLQEAIDDIAQPSLVVLGYGLCGNGLRGIKAGIHTLLVPRTDDCIAILLGSYEAYTREFRAAPGTYYLTKGWLESGSNPLQEYENYVPKYGAERAMWVMDQQYQHYERLVLVARNQADLNKYRSQAQEIARFCARWSMRYEEIKGTDDYMQQLVEAAMAYDGNGGTLRAELEKDILLVPPGGEIRQNAFIRGR
jgi:hypothetical protein